MNNLSPETTNILEQIKLYQPVRSSYISQKIGISSKNLYKHLNTLLDAQLIGKKGTPPKVYYSIKTEQESAFDATNPENLIIEQSYIYISPIGEISRGVQGFIRWCNKNGFEFDLERKKYTKKLKTINSIKKNGLISAKKRILSGKNKIYLNDIFFSDFYTMDYFGKTKLGQLVYIGKQSQNKSLIAEIATTIRSDIYQLIKNLNISMIGYIPPTIDRKVQILDILGKNLRIDLPKVNIEKIQSPTKIAQKTLHKLEDRILNAQKTINLNPNQKITGNILLIDDATGSGATLNETALKIKNIADTNIKVYGYSIIGSYKGFDVISEV